MASNSTTGHSTEETYECTLNNQCATIISLSLFFGLLFLCACASIIIRFTLCCERDAPLDATDATDATDAAHNQDPKPLQSQENPIRVASIEEDPC